MPLQRRIPKFGFKNPNRVEYKPVNLDSIQELAEKLKADKIDFQTLVDNGIVGKRDLVKILSRGEIKSKVEVEAHAFSKNAQKAIEDAGGKVTQL